MKIKLYAGVKGNSIEDAENKIEELKLALEKTVRG